MSASGTEKDIWSRWLLHTRDGGDAEARKRGLEMLQPIRDRVLENADLQPGETLLDVGCGDGLIAFGALERSPETQVIFCDVSQDLLAHAERLAQALGLAARCGFVQAAAQDLSPLADRSVQAVTTRSVLIYVEDKQAAFDEFYRVLAPGGRLSIWEPINSFRYPPPEHVFMGYDLSPVRELVVRLRAAYQAQLPSKSPAGDAMVNFDERDLFAKAEAAGFSELHLQYEAAVQPARRPPSWEAFYKHAPNPLSPTLQELAEQTLTAEERADFIAALRPLVEAGQGSSARAGAYPVGGEMTRAALGLESGQVAVRPYSPAWPRLFEAEKRRLRAALGERVLAIEHIGSTSVPGLAAEPLLDIGVAVASFEIAHEYVPLVEALGYVYRGENGIPRRHYFVRGQPRTHHLHMLEPDSLDWQRVIAFRDALRQRPELVREYADLKQRLALQYPQDSQAYTEAKTDFILAVVAAGR